MPICTLCRSKAKQGKGKCWKLPSPLCGNCAYEMDHEIALQLEAFMQTPTFQRFLQKKIEPVFKKFKQPTKDPYYKKEYPRRPSTNGGRFRATPINLGDSMSIEIRQY